MQVSDMLRVKGATLFTITPDTSILTAIHTMAERDIGSLVVMKQGTLAGMLTFREVIKAIAKEHDHLVSLKVSAVMDSSPLTCSPQTKLEEVRRMMLIHHARYLPVMDEQMLMGVISFYDVAKTVVEAQDFENSMLKAYIRDWPEGATQ